MKRFLVRIMVICGAMLSLNALPYSQYTYKPKRNLIKDLDYLVVFERVYDCYIPLEYQNYISYLSKWYSVPVWVLARVITRESNWVYNETNLNANKSIDIGMMQLNSDYLDYYYWRFNDLESIDVFNPYDNIELGVKYLRHLYELFGSWEIAVAAYNCGPTRILAGKGIPEKTQEYVDYVFQYRLIRKEVKPYEWTKPEFKNSDS